MTNYKESSVAGSVYQRCRYVQIDNTINQVPKLYFLEEEVVVLPGRDPMRRDLGSMDLDFNPENTINLIDPSTGEPLGTQVTQEYLYVILHSLYIQSATARDAAVILAEQTKAEDEAKRIAVLTEAMTPKAETNGNE